LPAFASCRETPEACFLRISPFRERSFCFAVFASQAAPYEPLHISLCADFHAASRLLFSLAGQVSLFSLPASFLFRLGTLSFAGIFAAGLAADAIFRQPLTPFRLLSLLPRWPSIRRRHDAASFAMRCRRRRRRRQPMPPPRRYAFCRQPLFAAAVAIARLFSSQTPIAGAISIPISDDERRPPMISFRPFSSAADISFSAFAFDAFRLFSSPPLFSPPLYASLSPPPFRQPSPPPLSPFDIFLRHAAISLTHFDYDADTTPTFSFYFAFAATHYFLHYDAFDDYFSPLRRRITPRRCRFRR
jgi:hypothetical protein